MSHINSILVYLFTILLLTSCGGGGGGSTTATVCSSPVEDQITTTDSSWFNNQWYLNDLNITNIHDEYNGSSKTTIIQVVDTGIEQDHEDLKSNLDLSYAYNAEISQSCNTEPDTNENHGTLCAGIASARGWNGKGIRGINPLGKVTGFKLVTEDEDTITYNQTSLEKAWLSGPNANEITVSSNSWGACTTDSTFEENILSQGVSLLRDGKGRIYVMPAGNDRGTNNSECLNGSSNLSTLTNNPYVITVAALKQNDTYANYSNPGSNILISTYGSNSNDPINITTTNINNTYSTTFGGTSASTPMAAGLISLLIEACPNLSYRDVKYILAKTATKVDNLNTTWVQNSAGLWHSTDYGYGKLNLANAINMCKNSYINLPELNTTEVTNSSSVIIPNFDTNISVDINITENMTVEWVGIYINAQLDNHGDFEYYLTSPSGTSTLLLHGNNALGDNDLDGDFRLSSVAFIDENSSGVWRVNISDQNNSNNNYRTINSIKLKIIGH